MKTLLEALLDGQDLSENQAAELMASLAAGTVEPAVAGALLAALRAKGAVAAEVRGFAKAMRALATKPDIKLDGPYVDTCGTGGDGSGSLNLSTGVALLTAGTGLGVVKHGNRSISSKSGSADVLETLGQPLGLGPQAAGQQLREVGFTFLFAPAYHPAMANIMPVRRALGVRTIFNLLGPIVNPARPRFQVVGAASPAIAELLANALAGLLPEGGRAFVVHGADGWDEATPIGPFQLFDVRGGEVVEDLRDPLDLGIPRCTPQDLAGGDAAYNAGRLQDVLEGRESGPHRDALVLGTALALEVSGQVQTPADGLVRARQALDSGSAAEVLDGLRRAGPAGAHLDVRDRREVAHG